MHRLAVLFRAWAIMNVNCILSSPFKGEVGRGMGVSEAFLVAFSIVEFPSPPLEGEGAFVHAIVS
jgi:hypothetical protein